VVEEVCLGGGRRGTRERGAEVGRRVGPAFGAVAGGRDRGAAGAGTDGVLRMEEEGSKAVARRAEKDTAGSREEGEQRLAGRLDSSLREPDEEVEREDVLQFEPS
jgi:hypothetical protein